MDDEFLALRMGKKAAELIRQSQNGLMVALKQDQITTIPLSEVVGRRRRVPQEKIAFARSLLTRL